MVKKVGVTFSRIPAWNAGKSLFWQTLGAVAAWGYVVALHWDNDGLWYQGDAAVHAANGLFWWDFLTRLPSNPLNFALSYYARYPVINPTAYPPVFYVLEGALYRIFGVSPLVAKGLVLGFVFLGTFYLIRWLRRWVGEAAGWAGVLFALQPVVIVWGHTVMLNVPCTALGIAALYHWRRWLEHLPSRHIYWAAGFALLATLTYLPTIVVVLIMVGWSVEKGQARAFLERRALTAAGASAGLLLPWAWVAAKWNPGYRQVAIYLGDYPFWKFASWIYYLEQVPRMVAIPLLLAALLGLGVGLWSKHWRKEVFLAVTWFAVCYLWFSFFSVKEQRYALLLVPPIVLIAAVGICGTFQALARMSVERGPHWIPTGLILLIVFHVWMAHSVLVPKVTGFQEMVRYLKHEAPGEWFFYDGAYSGVFTFYLRAEDPHFSNGVIRASKLLYATKIDPKFGLVENVSSPEQVVDLLQRQCGCRFLVIERRIPANIQAEHYLRQALAGNQFRLVRSFHLDTPGGSDVDLYTFASTVSSPGRLDLQFPILGDNVRFWVKPIEP